MDSVSSGSSKRRFLLTAGLVLLVALVAAVWVFLALRSNPAPQQTASPAAQTPKGVIVPALLTSVVADGLSNPWDTAFLGDGTMLFTERSGTIKARASDGTVRLLLRPDDVRPGGEGGMMGLAVDADFAANRYVYACFNTTNGDVRVARWRVSQDIAALEQRTDIVTGLPANPSGRHSGCKPVMDNSGVLWIGTGDAAAGTNPQDPQSLGGKILRVDRDGRGAAGNLDAPFDGRVYSYGHRNVQGLALLQDPRGGVSGYSAEQGTDRDDEVNELKPGNFGWDPVPGYDETVPMTDTERYPTAISPIWSSGTSTIATSGITVLRGKQWGAWEGALALGALKGRQVRILRMSDDGKVLDQSAQLTGFGRIRSVNQGPDGSLYFTTDNGGGQDKIIKVTPKLS